VGNEERGRESEVKGGRRKGCGGEGEVGRGGWVEVAITRRRVV